MTMIPASTNVLKVLDSYRPSRGVTRAQALEELVSRANDFLTFEIASENVRTRTRGVPVTTILKEAQSAVDEFRAARGKH